MRIRSLSLLTTMAVVLSLLISTGASRAVASESSYVALGDSIAAGTGNPVIAPGDPCLRSASAYPFQLAALKGLNVTNLACSGAAAYNGILTKQSTGLGSTVPAQLGMKGSLLDPPNPIYDAAQPSLVSLTDGANELNFGTWLLLCYAPGVDCSALLPAADTALPLVYGGIRAVLREIQSRGQASGRVPTVLLTTYFDPFGPVYRDCPDISPNPLLQMGLNREEVRALRQQLSLLNNTIRGAAAGFSNVRVVDIQPALAGHELCSRDPWVLGFSSSAFIHPNPSGQQSIASSLAAAI